MKGIYAIGGRIVRTPGSYNRVDAETGRPTRKALKNTNEYIHASVRSRSFLDAPGIHDNGFYESKAMAGFKLRTMGPKSEDRGPLAVWESKAKKKGLPKVSLREAPLFETEKSLLRFSPAIDEFVHETQDEDDRR